MRWHMHVMLRKLLGSDIVKRNKLIVRHALHKTMVELR